MTYHTYLPVIIGEPNFPIGVQLEIYNNVEIQARYIGSRSWIYYHIYWGTVEKIKDIYDWTVPDNDMLYLNRFYKTINIKTSPYWSRIYPESECSPPKEEYIENLANFCIKVIERYSPKAIYIWNEPEVDPILAHNNHWDHYLGGFGPYKTMAQYYGTIIKEIYKKIKPIYRKVLLIAGEMLFGELSGGDLNYSIDWWNNAKLNCEGYYDAVSFHAYPQRLEDFDLVNIQANKLKTESNEQNIWCTETSYITRSDGTYDPTFETDQTNYLSYIVNNNSVNQLAWYALMGNWRRCGLIENNILKPVYYKYRELTL
mgnify:CR=1 FL=1